MSLTETIRLYGQNGPGNFDDLIKICSPLINHIKEGKFINGSLISFMDELYLELVKRGLIKRLSDINIEEKKRIWAKAKGSGVKDEKTLIQHCRCIYVAEMI